MIAFEPPAPVAVPPSDPEIRQRLRLQSIGWALAAGISAGLLSLPWGLEAAVRSGGCGLFYGSVGGVQQQQQPVCPFPQVSNSLVGSGNCCFYCSCCNIAGMAVRYPRVD